MIENNHDRNGSHAFFIRSGSRSRRQKRRHCRHRDRQSPGQCDFAGRARRLGGGDRGGCRRCGRCGHYYCGGGADIRRRRRHQGARQAAAAAVLAGSLQRHRSLSEAGGGRDPWQRTGRRFRTGACRARAHRHSGRSRRAAGSQSGHYSRRRRHPACATALRRAGGHRSCQFRQTAAGERGPCRRPYRPHRGRRSARVGNRVRPRVDRQADPPHRRARRAAVRPRRGRAAGRGYREEVTRPGFARPGGARRTVQRRCRDCRRAQTRARDLFRTGYLGSSRSLASCVFRRAHGGQSARPRNRHAASDCHHRHRRRRHYGFRYSRRMSRRRLSGDRR